MDTFTPQIPQALSFLVSRASRYKVAFGGRGAGKSWAYSDALLVKALERPCRILCCREIQNSIRDSVHRLLHDRIAHHGLEDAFDVTENEIRCANGSQFIFKGLRSNTTEIKSLEGVDYCWVEEATKVSEESWNILAPTIRNPESEIWISFNTGTEADPVYKRFVMSNRADTLVVKVNYYDNPWFPEVLRKEMEHDKENDYARYKHVWLGEPGAEGQFFVEFGPHLAEEPFEIEESDLIGWLFGSLDSGTSHPTSFGLWWVAPNKQHWNERFGEQHSIHRLMTYKASGGTIAGHSHDILSAVQSFPWTRGHMPKWVAYDPAMETKSKLNELMVRAQIDEYREVWPSSTPSPVLPLVGCTPTRTGPATPRCAPPSPSSQTPPRRVWGPCARPAPARTCRVPPTAQ